MNRSEFLDKLREALENDLSGPVVRENIEYYDSYIQSEVRNGKTEQEVLDMLGDPWMIARTIIDTDENEREYYGSASGTYSSVQNTYTEEEEEQNNSHPILHLIGIDTWWKRILFFAGIVIVLFIIVAVITGLIAAVLPFALPLFDTGADPAYDEWTLKEGGVVLMKAAPPLFVPATRQSPKAAKILAATYDAGTCISKRPMGEPSVF